MRGLTHLGEDGRARMVDVGDKPATRREARAEGSVAMDAATVAAIASGGIAKGDVLRIAELAGIMAAKQTATLIPLCHPLGLSSITVEVRCDSDLPGVRVAATASLTGQTGVEMEVLTAVSVACLTVYDMAKAIDRGMVIGDIRLVAKSGGRSGEWMADR